LNSTVNKDEITMPHFNFIKLQNVCIIQFY
jgi:hypothetical protein